MFECPARPVGSRPQKAISWPILIPSYLLLAGQPWCFLRECGELHCGQRLLWAAAPLWLVTCSEPLGPSPHCTPTSPRRWEGQRSQDTLPEALGPEQHRNSPSLRWAFIARGRGARQGILPEQGWECRRSMAGMRHGGV